MKYRISKVYTRKGDEGYTRFRGNRISKDDLLIETVGNIDELNAHIGFLLSLNISDEKIITSLTRIQHELFNLGGELHSPDVPLMDKQKVKELENALDQWNNTLEPLTEFLLPQGNVQSTFCHIARTVCRRAERSLVALHSQLPLTNLTMLAYLNRLSDLLFVLSRILAKENHSKEILWEK